MTEPFGSDLDTAVDALLLDPAGPLHGESGRLLVVGEVKRSMKRAAGSGTTARDDTGNPARPMDAGVCRGLFVPVSVASRAGDGTHVVDARTVMDVPR